MIVRCPQCETVFAVPDEAYRPGRKARCSQCSHVFRLPEITDPAEKPADLLPEPALPPRKNRKIAMFLAFIIGFILLGSAGYAVFFYYPKYKLAKQNAEHQEMVDQRRINREREAEQNAEENAAVASIKLVDVRQMVVKNDSLGPLVVIQGYAKNNFDYPVEFIMVEGRLLDKTGKVLSSGAIYAGINLDLSQLQVFSQDELKKALNNKISVLANNVDIQPGSQVPFVLVFVGIPENLASFEVRPLSAQKVQK